MGTNKKSGELKIALVGAGSNSFGKAVIVDVLSSRDLAKKDTTLFLMDINELALKKMFLFAGMVKEYKKTTVKILAASNYREALSGADYVITSVAKKRMECWEKDFCIPVSLGFKHVLGENGGPGAAFHTLRSLNLMIPVCREMERFCPEALLLNFTNPESRICLGVNKLTRIKAVGLCHGAFGTLQAVSKILGKKEKDIDLEIGGINHFHWALSIKDKKSGKDLYPEFRKKIKEGDVGPLAYLLYRKFGLLPFPSDNHIGEYISFAYDICGPFWLKYAEQIGHPEYPDRIKQIVDGKISLTPDFVRPSAELAVPIITDVEFDRNRKELSVNILNKSRAVPNLPEDAIVEVPAVVNGEGIHPVKVDPLPEAIASMCLTQIAIQNLLIRAYSEKSKDILLQALILDPIVDSMPRAEKMMETLIRVEKNLLPELR
ncbi:MAG: hypothetical protein JW957_05545 [Candidatus Omnitrophica bacterium]|nr:hypothetical protein [Candidatus Omnitrophota bacterium]